MPMGSENAGTGNAVPKSRFIFSTKNPLYLNMPKSPKFSTREEIRASFAPIFPLFFSMISP